MPARRYEEQSRGYRITASPLLVDHRVGCPRRHPNRIPHTGRNLGGRPQARPQSRLGLGRGDLRPLDPRRIRGTDAPLTHTIFLAREGGHESRSGTLERHQPLVDGYSRRSGVAGRVDRRERPVEQGRDRSGQYAPRGPLPAQDVRRRRQGQARRPLYQRSRLVGVVHQRRAYQRRRPLTHPVALLDTRILQRL